MYDDHDDEQRRSPPAPTSIPGRVLTFVVILALGVLAFTRTGQRFLEALWGQGAAALASAANGASAVPGVQSSAPSAIAVSGLPSPNGFALPWLSLILAAFAVWVGIGAGIYMRRIQERSPASWGEFLLWRWPVLSTLAFVGKGRGPWAQELWHRHEASAQKYYADWNKHRAATDLARVGRILLQGFEASEENTAVVETVIAKAADGAPTQKIRVRVFTLRPSPASVVGELQAGDSIGTLTPGYPQGGLVRTAHDAWLTWAAKYGRAALVSENLDAYDLAVDDATGVVTVTRRTAAASENLPPPEDHAESEVREPNSSIDPSHPLVPGGLAPSILGLRAMRALSKPLPKQEINRVVQVFKGQQVTVTPEGGVSGIRINVALVRPLAAQVQTAMNKAGVIGGMLGTGDSPVRISFLAGRPGILAVEYKKQGGRPAPVRLVEAIMSTARTQLEDLARMALPCLVGVMPDGSAHWMDASLWPHLLIGGQTGGGKSVGVRGMVASMCMCTPPDKLRLTLMDPKGGGEFAWSRPLPHLDALLVDVQDLVVLVQQWVEETENRYRQFGVWGVPDLSSAHAAGLGLDLPRRLLVVDEYKDVKDQLADDPDILKTFQRNIGRIGQKARAAGMHVWIATQYPTVDAVDRTFKSNLPSRLAFRMSTNMNSRVILDDGGAETLLGNGDCLIKGSQSSQIMRIQTAFTDTKDFEAIAQAWGTQGNRESGTGEGGGEQGQRAPRSFPRSEVPFVIEA